MTFGEFLTYAELKGLIINKKFIDVSPLGVQYRVKVIHADVHTGHIHYREINGNYIMTGNGLIVRGRGMQIDIPTIEIIDILS